MFDVFNILKMLLTILPFVLLCLAGKKVNLKKTSRSRQFLMPIVVLIYCIVAFLLIDKINSGLMWVVNSIPGWLSFMSPEVETWVGNMINRINWSYWIFYISNLALLVAYYVFKMIVIAIFLGIFGKNGGLHKSVAEVFYEYDQGKNIWTVQEKFGQTRTYFKTFFYSATILSSLMFLICKKFMQDGLIVAPFFPLFGILIVAELYFFLDGLTREEYANDVLGEDEDATMIVNYSLMRKFLRKMFGDKLDTENTVSNNLLETTNTNDEIIQGLLLSEDGKIEAFGKYVKALSDTGFALDHNYIRSTIDMLKGKSVLFNNPFYNDLIPYAFYPMNRTLLRHKKVMIVLGRHSIEKDIAEWVVRGITSVTNVPTMWRVGELTGEPQDLDIGIVTRSDVHNVKLLESNREFFSQVEYVVIVEPSKLVSTAQVGLNSLIKYCRNDQRNIVFCSCDKNCDGLVDSLSHILMTSLSEVSATNKNLSSTSYMCWDYDSAYWQHKLFPNISRYLGIGTELSVAALKNQIPKAEWYGGETYPVVDQLWIDRQYFFDLLKYSGLVPRQEELVGRINATANLWSADVEKNSYMTVEDESNNMFEIVRTFSTRATEQGFINVISGEYLLKEYMADNAFIFAADPKAIPYIVADYARTDRNVTFRLLLMLSANALTAEEIGKELSLMGIKTDDVKATLWGEILKCYSSVTREYRKAHVLRDELFIEDLATGETTIFHSSIIEDRVRYNVGLGEYEKVYTIKDAKFIALVITELQSAGYLAEDEKGETYYLGAELRGHVFQRHLPGQFFTFDGKYYEMCSLSGDNQVIVRRAADHITGRPLYRQLRTYTINKTKASTTIGSQKIISGMLLSNEYADIQVETPAYLDMPTAKDYVNAETVSINSIPIRDYKNKKILRVELPDVTDDVRYTITYLLNEVFRTTFAENQHFISAVTAFPASLDGEDSQEQDIIRPLTYSLCDNSANSEAKSIYIIEDSQLDLGLLIAVERNFKRILEIVCDFLDWHLQAIEDSKNPQPGPEPIELEPVPEVEPKKKKGICRFFKWLWEKIKAFFRWLFRRKKKEPATTGEIDVEPITDSPDPNTHIADGSAEKQGASDVVEAEPEEEVPENIEDEPIEDVSEQAAEEDPQEEIDQTVDDSDRESDELPASDDDELEVDSETADDDLETEPVIGETDIVGEDEINPEQAETAVEEAERSVDENGLTPEKTDLPEDTDMDMETDGKNYLACSAGNSDDFVLTGKIEDDYTDVSETEGVAEPENGMDEQQQDVSDEVPGQIQDESESESSDEAPGEDAVKDDADEQTSEPELVDEPEVDNVGTEPETTAEPEKPQYGGSDVDEPAVPETEEPEKPGEGLDFVTEDDGGKRPAGIAERDRYHYRHFLLFGNTEETPAIVPTATKDYLAGLGVGQNSLKQARDGKDIAKMIAETYNPKKPDAHFCDFCGIELAGTEYEVLADGRERCMNCGKTAMKTGEEFTKIFKDVLRNMEAFYGVKINAGIRVEMVNSKKLHRRLKRSFVPSNKCDPRVLGVAIKDSSGYSILIENGSPRMASIMTIAHELTHIWQYLNWKDKDINAKYGKDIALEIYEGMAKWVEIQYAILINEVAVAKREEIETVLRNDEYGRGFIKYLNKYPFSMGTHVTKQTPFLNKENPL